MQLGLSTRPKHCSVRWKKNVTRRRSNLVDCAARDSDCSQRWHTWVHFKGNPWCAEPPQLLLDTTEAAWYKLCSALQQAKFYLSTTGDKRATVTSQGDGHASKSLDLVTDTCIWNAASGLGASPVHFTYSRNTPTESAVAVKNGPAATNLPKERQRWSASILQYGA